MTDYAQDTESEAQPEPGGEERGNTLFASADMIPNSDSLKPGAKLVFNFIGKDADGDLELEYSKPAEEEMSLGDDLKNAVMKG